MAKNYSVWDILAKKYDKLWVQKYSLAPTRKIVREVICGNFSEAAFALIDLGCGTGQLLSELRESRPDCRFFGVDKSPEMVRLAKSRNEGIEVFCEDADDGDLCRIFSEDSIDAVVCCHSFPYYKNKAAVLKAVHDVLSHKGIAVFVQASINNLYDRLVLRAVEATAEKADYLSREAFKNLAKEYFEIAGEFSVRERFYMPSICGFMLRKRL